MANEQVMLPLRKRLTATLLVLSILFLVSCGGGGGSSSGSSASAAVNVSGQALLGPLSGATVEIIDPYTGQVIYSTQTTSSNNLAEAGTFSLRVDALSDSALYLVRVSGGLDIDANDDGKLDAVPTLNNGTIHLIVSGQRVKQGKFNVSLLTELVFRRLAHLLQSGIDQRDLLAEMDRRAAWVLERDIDGDGDRDSDDLAVWHPQFNSTDIRNGLAAYQPLISSIHDNDISSSGNLMSADALLGASASGRSPSAVVKNNIAYVADGTLGLNIVDISQPNAPALLASLDSPGLALGVAVNGGIAYLADAASGLQVISVSDPASPATLGRLATSGEARGVVVANGVVYVLDSIDGLLVLNTSNPAQPQVSATVPVDGDPLGITTESQYPDRLLLPVRLPDGTEVDFVYLIAPSGGIILEGTLGPDPDNPGLEKILVTNPANTPPGGGFTEEPPIITNTVGSNGDSVILEGTLSPGQNNGGLDSALVNNPGTGGIEGFLAESLPNLN